MHGLLETSASWIALGPKHSLGEQEKHKIQNTLYFKSPCDFLCFKHEFFSLTGYLLYDNGYDVWMGNCRGTRPSRGHVRFNSTGAQRKQYWSFSLHEIGIYDLPASIDYILEKTNQSQLHYVGYSQGTTLFFIMTSIRPEYNEKIISMIAMAPAVFVKHSQHTFLNVLSEYYALIKKVVDYYKIYSIDYGNKALRWLAEFACKKIGNKSPFPCQFLLFFLDSNQINCVC